MTVKEQIVNKSIELLAKEPTGIRFSVLVRKLEEELPEIKPKNIPAKFGASRFRHSLIGRYNRVIFDTGNKNDKKQSVK